ncbi:MAG: hypothetical protein R2932_19680 [Caldilineaceae bacterium]
MQELQAKQSQVKELVIGYFRQRADTPIVSMIDDVYEISLDSELARQSFGGSKRLKLSFDPELFSENPDSELITSSHPFLEIIRNDLQSDANSDPRIGEAYIHLNLINEIGELDLPEVNLDGSRYETTNTINYIPTYLFVYKVLYDRDERSENIIRICYHPDWSLENSNQKLLPLLDEFELVGGRPSKVASEPPVLTDAVVEVRSYLSRQIEIDLISIRREIADILSNRINGAKLQYENDIAQLRSQDTVGRQQLTDRLNKDIQDLERKFACHVKIDLLSILTVWWPSVNYHIVVPSVHGKFSIDGFRYDTQLGKATFRRCPKCDNEHNFCICTSGRHVECSNHIEIFVCSTCYESMCLQHGGLCEHCHEPVCLHDNQLCMYGSHLTDFHCCPDCITTSFEGKPLCKDCISICAECQRKFAHEHTKECRIGGETICISHLSDPCGHRCSYCSAVICQQHSLLTISGSRVCLDHGRKSTCCERTFALDGVEICCVDANELLCIDHRFSCMDCFQSVCEQHSTVLHLHRDKRICANCRLSCYLCDSQFSYSQKDLTTCVICHSAVCSEHLYGCAVCAEPVCANDIRVTKYGEYVCKAHAGHCAYCTDGNDIHMIDRLKSSIISKNLMCQEHRNLCEVCQQNYVSLEEIPGLDRCAGCNRFSCGDGRCSAQMNKCSKCQLSYCTHCCGNGICQACSKLSAIEVNEKIVAYVSQYRSSMQETIRTYLDSVLENIDYMLCWYARNETYQVMIIRCRPPRIMFWKSHLSAKQIRLVSDNNGRYISSYLEPVDS